MEYLTQIIQFTKIFILFFILSPILEVNAQVYKWVDENGKVHYSDKPVDKKSEAVKMKRQPTSQEINQAKRRASSLMRHKNKVLDIIEEEENDKQYAQQKSEKEQKERLRTCAYAKDEARTLAKGYRSYTIGDDGEKYFLSDAEKEAMIAKINQFIKKRCQP